MCLSLQHLTAVTQIEYKSPQNTTVNVKVQSSEYYGGNFSMFELEDTARVLVVGDAYGFDVKTVVVPPATGTITLWNNVTTRPAGVVRGRTKAYAAMRRRCRVLGCPMKSMCVANFAGTLMRDISCSGAPPHRMPPHRRPNATSIVSARSETRSCWLTIPDAPPPSPTATRQGSPCGSGLGRSRDRRSSR